MNWLECSKVDMELLHRYDSDTITSVLQFIDENSHIRNHVWKDLITGDIFSTCETRKHNNRAAFLDTEEGFCQNNVFGIESFNRKKYIQNGKKIDYFNNEIIISGYDKLTKFKDSKILIIGAGPSARDFEDKWRANIDEYDYVWSCNHYFQVKFLKDIKFDLVSLGNEVDIRNQQVLERINRDNSLIAVETNISREEPYFSNFIQINDKRSLFFSTRFFGSIGSIPRMLVLATQIGAKNISLVGMDGLVLGAPSSCFQEEKISNDPARHGSLDINLYRRHYVTLWDYLLSHNTTNTHFFNYGSGHASNMTGDIPNNR